MTWKQRIRGEITMVSPDSFEFTPKWISNPRSKAKKLGVFDYAKVKGTIVQDLGITSGTYPLTLYFDGQDNDKDAEKFWGACDQDGIWEITHPTKGFLGLQLVKVSESVNPTSEGNYTVFDTEWIEPIDPVTLKTAAQLAAEAGRALNEFNSVAADQFVGKIKTDTFGERFAVTNTAKKITDKMGEILGPIASTVDAINSNFNEALTSVQEILEATILDPLALAASIQNLSQLPMLAVRDVKSRLNSYGELFREIFGIEPERADTSGANVASVKELSYSAIIGGMSIIATTGISNQEQAKTKGQTNTGVVLDVVTQIPVTTDSGAIQTQLQAIEAIEAIGDLNTDIINDLDTSQELFQGSDIDIQYFSQTESFASAMNLTALGQAFLLFNFFNLKLEKTFVLKEHKTPIQVTIEEYGGMGENDSNLDLFIYSNGLKGNEVILMPSGKEVVIYA